MGEVLSSVRQRQAGKNLFTLPGTSSDDAWWIKVGRDQIPDGLKFSISVYGNYGKDRVLLSGPHACVGGAVTDRDGNPLKYSELGGTWPGHADDDGNRVAEVADSVEAEITFSKAASAEIALSSMQRATFDEKAAALAAKAG